MIYFCERLLTFMTDKQARILQAALELFANEGYTATSTSRIAKHAGVSEGLIFRHFNNKEGLLQAIMDEAEQKVKKVFSEVTLEADPKMVIEKMLDFTSSITSNKTEADFWKLQYKIKWEIETYNDKKIEPLESALENAFDKLDYSDPGMEAKLFLILLDGLATRFYLQEDYNWESMVVFLKKKYLL